MEQKRPQSTPDIEELERKAERISHPPSVPPSLVEGALAGAAAGVALGSIAGPPGMIAGAIVGTAIGTASGVVIGRSEHAQCVRDDELDRDIGVYGKIGEAWPEPKAKAPGERAAPGHGDVEPSEDVLDNLE